MRKNNEVYCNKCSKLIKSNEDILQEDVLQIEKVWGYFSGRDGEKHTFDLCENCYENMINEFQIPVEISEESLLI